MHLIKTLTILSEGKHIQIRPLLLFPFQRSSLKSWLHSWPCENASTSSMPRDIQVTNLARYLNVVLSSTHTISTSHFEFRNIYNMSWQSVWYSFLNETFSLYKKKKSIVPIMTVPSIMFSFSFLLGMLHNLKWVQYYI